MNTDNGPKLRIRLKFARLKPARELSHLEQIKTLRAIIAASGLDYWPVKCGRTAAPKMSFGPAISMGYESACEYADLYLAEFVGDAEVAEKIRAVRSEQYNLISAKRVPMFFPAIESCVNAAEYFLEAEFPSGFSQIAADEFLARERMVYEKVKPSGSTETIDVKPLVMRALYEPAASAFTLVLKVEPGKNVKPEVVLNMIAGCELPAPRCCRPGEESAAEEPPSGMVIKRIVRKELYWFDSGGKPEVF